MFFIQNVLQSDPFLTAPIFSSFIRPLVCSGAMIKVLSCQQWNDWDECRLWMFICLRQLTWWSVRRLCHNIGSHAVYIASNTVLLVFIRAWRQASPVLGGDTRLVGVTRGDRSARASKLNHALPLQRMLYTLNNILTVFSERFFLKKHSWSLSPVQIAHTGTRQCGDLALHPW